MRLSLAAERAWAQQWLFGWALPLWWHAGADHDAGGFYDKLDQCGRPLDLPKRLRVQARQVFVYAEAGRLGWAGPAVAAIRHGLDFMLAAFAREDGLFRASVDRQGRPVADEPDLYDQAFVLFALAAAYVALDRPAALRNIAERLLARMTALLAHPIAGFEEARPRRLPLRSNPHMHLLEALLAWVEAGGGDMFAAQAREIVTLALGRLIDPATGAIGEYYDGEWRFAADPAGSIREPGHQFEWAYLLDLAARMLDDDHRSTISRLHDFGERFGVREGVVLFALDAAGAVIDQSARLWAQTERLRTAAVRGDMAGAASSISTLRRFLDVPCRGLWHERLDVNGRWIDEPSPASSLYHITTGLSPLILG